MVVTGLMKRYSGRRRNKLQNYGGVLLMKEYKGTNHLISSDTVIKISQVQRRIGFSEGYIEIRHALVGKDDDFGFDFCFYEEDTNFGAILYSLAEKDCQNSNLQEVAKRLANEIIKKIGLKVKVIKEIQGSREELEYDEFAEKMWIAKMAMQGIDDDY